MKKHYGAIEAGGTKFVCAVGTGPEDYKEIRFPTTNPGATLQRAVDFFLPYQEQLRALGVGSFGPVDLAPQSLTYGSITTTPKAGWANTDVLGILSVTLNLPVAFDTDVNAAAVGEGRWGAAQGLTDYLYMTIGTGIGGGVVANGRLIHGLVHPELGHSFITRRADDSYQGHCPYHGHRCLEGLASGPAMAARWQVSAATELPADHPAWALEADYIAQALVNCLCLLSPQRIILGGGVMEQKHLLALVQCRVMQLLNGYIQHDNILKHIDQVIVSPGLGNRAGVLGAMVLAQTLVG